MRVLFMGTPDFAVSCLEGIHCSQHEVCAVITQPDKPRGRKMVMTPPSVKVYASEHDIPVYQPTSLKSESAFEIIKELKPDVIVVAAYGKLLPKQIIDYPKYGCINVHGSILPKYRGAAPIQWAVINGETETGVTIMQMDEGLDTGDMLLVEKIPIEINDTASSVFDKLAFISRGLIVKALDMSQTCGFEPVKQNDAESTYAPMLDKSISEIDWTKSSDTVHNLVRGLYDWPIANTTYHGKKLKIYGTRLSDLCGKPGEVVSVSPLTIACGTGAVEITQLQLEGKKRMDSMSFTAGHKMSCGDNITEVK